jgi:NADH-quinone oxidoreductase subunit E
MARLTPDNTRLAHEIIDRYPVRKSALIPLLHLAQEQDGWVADDAMEHLAELVGVTPAEVLGTCSFYEMFKRRPVGRYQINICTNISCQLLGGEELLEHAEESLGIKSGGTTPDGVFSLEDVECIAACTEAPACQVNYRYVHNVTNDDFDQLIADIRSGARDDIPLHGTLAKVRQDLVGDRIANITPPEEQVQPVWIARHEQEAAAS